MTPKSERRIKPSKEEVIFPKALPLEEAKLNDYWEQYKNQYIEFLKVGAPPKHKPVSEGTIITKRIDLKQS